MLISCLFVFKCGLNGWMAGGLAFNISYNIEANRERKQNSPKTKTEKDMTEGIGGRREGGRHTGMPLLLSELPDLSLISYCF